jgi:hypothetical protein
MRLGFRHGAGGHSGVTVMNRRATGVVFIAIAAFLFATRYIAAAIFGSGVRSWEAGLFDAMLAYVGPELPILSAVSLLIGIVYLIRAESTRTP